MSNTINVNYMTRAYNQYQQKNAAKDQEKEDTRFADSVREKSEEMCIRDSSGCRSIPNRNLHTKLLIKDFQAFVLPFPVSWNRALQYLPCH